MTTAYLTWLCAGWVLAILVWLGLRRQKLQHTYVRSRSPYHENLLDALAEWTAEPDILKAAQRAGIITAQGLKDTRDSLGRMDEPALRAIAAAFLQDRHVRQQVAKHMERKHGVPRAQAMKGLWQMVEAAKG